MSVIVVSFSIYAWANQHSDMSNNPSDTDMPDIGGIEGTVTDHNGRPIAGMRVSIVSGTTGYPEIAIETNEEGYYLIGSVPLGTFGVAVHDKQGNRICLESVTVRGGEASTLNFAISPLTQFKAVVNGMSEVDVFVRVNISDGLTEVEAKQIVEATFIQVMGKNVTRQLDAITINDSQIKAHYFWGYNENDTGHVFDMDLDLTTLKILVSRCF
jgi:hypothetical protein